MSGVTISRSGFEKLQVMMEKIQALSNNEKGYCFAGNKYLARELGGISDREVRRRLSILKDLRWVGAQVNYKEITNRSLYLLPGGQNVLLMEYDDLPEIVRGRRTIHPPRVDNTSVGADNTSTNLVIQNYQVNQERAANDTGNDYLVRGTTGVTEGAERESDQPLYETCKGGTGAESININTDRDKSDSIRPENGFDEGSGAAQRESADRFSYRMLPQRAAQMGELGSNDREKEEARIAENVGWFRANVRRIA